MANVKISNLPTETILENITGAVGYRTSPTSGELETVQFDLGPLSRGTATSAPGLKFTTGVIESTFSAGSAVAGIELKTNNNINNESSILISSNGGGSGAALKLRSATDIQVDLPNAPDGAGKFLVAKDTDGNLEWSDSSFANVPTDNSQLLNGAEYITSDDVPTDNSQLANGAGYITSVPQINLADTNQVTGMLKPINGGTGVTSLDDGHILLGGGNNAISTLDLTEKGSIVVGDGTTAPVALGVGGDGDILTADSSETSGLKWTNGSGTNSFMLVGIIDGVASSSSPEFTNFGGRVDGVTNQGSGFTVFVDSSLTHISFKYLSDDSLSASIASYSITVYESINNFENFPADNVSSYTALQTVMTITGDGAGGTDAGSFPFKTVALTTPISLTAGRFYAVVGTRNGSGLFSTAEEAQITLRITE